MAMTHLDFGDSVAGLLLDGVEHTPFVGATLRLLDPHGIRIEVPYFSDPSIEQFSNAQHWFESQSPPSNMLLYAPDGVVSLFDITWSGHLENWGGVRTSVGTLAPNEAVLAHREGPLGDPLEIAEVHSQLDGLREWSRLDSVSYDPTVDDEGRVQGASYKLTGRDSFEWIQGAARVSIQSGWTVDHDDNGLHRAFVMKDAPSLVTVFDEPRSFWDHFVEQRKVATLLVLLFGRPIGFRQHKVRDERFVARMMDGQIYDRPRRELISRRTIRDRLLPVPTVKELGRPIAHLETIGAEGLAAWSAKYEQWQRFILPTASVLGRKGSYVEDVVVSTSMALEAAGGILGEQEGERVTWHRNRPTTAPYAYRCLHIVNVEWGDVADKVGLARAIAKNYNDVKHYDRGDFPDQIQTYLISRVNRLLVRLIALTLTGKGELLLAPFRTGREMWAVTQEFQNNERAVLPDGTWQIRSGEKSIRRIEVGEAGPEQKEVGADPVGD